MRRCRDAAGSRLAARGHPNAPELEKFGATERLLQGDTGHPNAPELSTSLHNVGGGATRRLLSFWSGDKDRGVAALPTLKYY
jgi:hypothetical protein